MFVPSGHLLQEATSNSLLQGSISVWLFLCQIQEHVRLKRPGANASLATTTLEMDSVRLQSVCLAHMILSTSYNPRTQRQEDQKLKVTPGEIMNLRPAWAMWDPDSKQKQATVKQMKQWGLIISPYTLFWIILFSKTGSHYVAPALLELLLQPGLASNSQRSDCPCLPSAGI